MVDDRLPYTMFDGVQVLSQVIGALVVVAIASPWILILLAPLIALFLWVRGWYIVASREIKRFEATTRSPVFAMFSAILKGLSTIRAYKAEERYMGEFESLITLNGSWWMAFLAVSRWIGTRLDYITAGLVMGLVTIIVIIKD